MSTGTRSNGIESGLRREERPATSPMRDDSVVLQFDSHFRIESLGRRSGLVRASVGAGAEPISKRCMVSVLQGKTGTHARQLRGMHRLVHKVVEESECLAAIPSSLLLGIDVDALLDAAMEQGGDVRYDVGKRI